MTEKDDLFISIAKTIKTYRLGEVAQPTPAHVERWANQFTFGDQLIFLREFDQVIRKTFLAREAIGDFLRNLATNEQLVGKHPDAYWARARFLRIQKAGQSQKEMVRLFSEILQTHHGISLTESGTEGGDYIYLDDVLFSGGRVSSDLQAWVTNDAPEEATVNVILIAFHTLGQYYANKRLQEIIRKSGKRIQVRYWRSVELENRRSNKSNSDVLWPASLPPDTAVIEYVSLEKRFPLEPRIPSGSLRIFSSEVGRQALESEFLVAGVKIRALTGNLNDWYRPLGCGNFGAGFGSLMVTYRNCPNNCPLALWWGDPEVASGALHWYPLLPRKTYAAPENVFNGFDDL